MKNNYKFILCLLLVIIASLSCVVASEDVNTTLIMENHGDTSINSHNMKYSGSDDILEVNNIDNEKNNNDNSDLIITDNDLSYTKSNDNVTIGSSSYSLDKPIKSNNVIIKATKYASGDSNDKNFSNLQNALNSTESGGNVSLNNTTWSCNVSNTAEEVGLNISNRNLTITGGNESQFGIINGNSTRNCTLIINESSNVTLKNIIFENFNNTPVTVVNGSVTFINCIFWNNNATKTTYDGAANASYGGAVYILNGTGNFTTCNFTQNTAIAQNYSYGGAVCIGTNSTGIFNDCNFKNNLAINNTTSTGNGRHWSQGGAVYIGINATGWFRETNFTGNKVINNGTTGGHYVYGAAVGINTNGTGNFTTCNFINSTAISSNSSTGGAIYINANVTLNFTTCNFINSTAISLNHSDGGAIYTVDNITGNFTDCNFINSTANSLSNYSFGGAISTGYDFICNFTGCNFINSMSNYGGAVYAASNNTFFNMTNCNFTQNTATISYTNRSYGGAVYMISGSTGIFNDCNFKNNLATNNELNSTSAHSIYAGAVFIGVNATGLFINTNFTGNKIINKGNNSYHTRGGAVSISNNGTGNFTDCNFINNTAISSNHSDGGAIYVNTNVTLKLEYCNFINSMANYGGAICTNNNTTGNLTCCNFINNTATTSNYSYGGALYIIGNDTIFSITDCNFTNNNALYGGAIGLMISNNTINLINSNFKHNNANQGGALYATGNNSNIYITQSNLIFNRATSKGGAIYNNVTIDLTDSKLYNNTALYGGAIYSENITNISKSIFNNNTGIHGGAIYINSNGKTKLTESTLKNNSANLGSAVFSAGEIGLKNNTNNGIVYLAYGATFTGGLNITVYANNKDRFNLYDYSVLLTANLTENVDIEGGIFFNITYNNKSIFYKAIRNDNGIYYYKYYIPEFGANYVVSVVTPGFGSNYNLYNANIVSVNQFNINITAPNVTVDNVNATANNTIDIYFLNGNHILAYNNVTVYVNNEKYILKLNARSEGMLILENLTVGEYNVTMVYGNNNTNINSSNVFYVKYPISINDTIITLKDNDNNTTDVSILFPPDASGNIIVTLNNIDYNTTIVGDIARFTVNDTFSDFANISIYYPGNKITEAFNESLILDLRKIILNINGSTVVTGKNSTVNVGLTINDIPADENVTLILTRNYYNKTFNASVVDGSSVLDLGVLAPGAYNVTVQYAGKTASTVVYVKNNITEEDITIEASKNANGTTDLTLTVPEGVTGNITFTLGDKNYTAEIINGTATVSTNQLYNEPFQVSVYYAGNDANYPFNYNYTFDTSKITVTVENVTMYYKNSSGVIVNVGMGDTPLANQTVYITINGRTYNRTTDLNGSAKLTVNLNPGIYNVTTIYTSADGQNYTVKSTVTVLSTISGENIVKYYRNATHYYATFIDGEGNRLAHKNVTFNINGIFYTSETDENGTASLAINLLPDKYIITAYNPINNESYSNNITVLSTLETTNLVKYFRNATQFTAKVTDGTGNAASGVLVTFNINGVFYSKTSDANGVATLNINLNPGDYIITTNNTLTGQSIGNTVKVLPVLTGQDLTKVYGQPAYYVAHLVNNQGNPSSNQAVTFNINGRMYHAFTDALGDARLAINLMPGSYIITASASINGGIQSNSNVITVVEGS